MQHTTKQIQIGHNYSKGKIQFKEYKYNSNLETNDIKNEKKLYSVYKCIQLTSAVPFIPVFGFHDEILTLFSAFALQKLHTIPEPVGRQDLVMAELGQDFPLVTAPVTPT